MSSTVRRHRLSKYLGPPLTVAVLAAATAGCTTTRHSSAPATTRLAPSTTAPTTTIAPGLPVGGSLTVLSPIGINVRKAPSPSAPVIGTAAQGAVFTVLGSTSDAGGWFNVKGATATGWITSEPTLSAPGTFHHYSSSDFTVLYPASWSEAPLATAPPAPATSAPTGSTGSTSTSVAAAAPSGVQFRPSSGTGDITVIAAGSVSQLPHGRAGYGVKSVTQVIACGTTAGLVVFERAGSPPASGSAPTSAPGSSSYLTYFAEVRFAVDKQHALGFYADTADLGPTFQIFKNLVASVTFNAPQCSG